MLDSSRFIDKFLQNCRFREVRPFLTGDVLDFGGNRGELGKYVKGKYLVVNHDYSMMAEAHYDTIVCLAVIEHIDPAEVLKIFRKFKEILKEDGKIFLTTPTKAAKPILEFMAFLGMIDKTSIANHKYYWRKKEIYSLAGKAGLVIKQYRKFQLGFNQLAVLEHRVRS